MNTKMTKEKGMAYLGKISCEILEIMFSLIIYNSKDQLSP